MTARVRSRTSLKLFYLALVLSSGTTPVSADSIDADATRIFAKARNQVVRLIVAGTARDSVAFKPPVFGTGFFASAGGQLRIFTAAHVVRPNEDWALLSASRVKRDVTHIAETDVGNLRFEPVTAVTYDAVRDIAQVGLGQRSAKVVTLRPDHFSTSEPYYVVSWGRNLDGGEFPYEPYIRRVTYIGQDGENPQLAQFQVDDSTAGFIETESGSPVMAKNGDVVGMLVQRLRRVDITDSGQSKVGLALPVTAISEWLASEDIASVIEPAIVKLASLKFVAELTPTLANMSDLCVFLGKRSAKFQDPEKQPRAADAPFGVLFLRNLDENPADPALLVNAIAVSEKAGAVNVRTRCPDVVQKKDTTGRKDRIAFYGAPYAQITPIFKVRLKEIRKLDYQDDYFYWGVIESVSTAMTRILQ
jgi:Trypsin-like peptidase domain